MLFRSERVSSREEMETIKDIAFRLAERRLTLTPPDRAPLFDVLDEAAAYELQAQTNAIISLKRGPVVGLKIGCTTPVMQTVTVAITARWGTP